MVFVPTLSTEVRAVEALLRLAGQKLLPLDCDDAVPWLLERGVRVAGTGNELVQLEREESSFVSSRCTTPSRLRHTRDEQKVPKRLSAPIFAAARVLSESSDCLREAKRARANPSLVDV
jgi:hypothetical protein